MCRHVFCRIFRGHSPRVPRLRHPARRAELHPELLTPEDVVLPEPDGQTAARTSSSRGLLHAPRSLQPPLHGAIVASRDPAAIRADEVESKSALHAAVEPGTRRRRRRAIRSRRDGNRRVPARPLEDNRTARRGTIRGRPLVRGGRAGRWWCSGTL